MEIALALFLTCLVLAVVHRYALRERCTCGPEEKCSRCP